MPTEPCPTCGQPLAVGRFGAQCPHCLLGFADEIAPDPATVRRTFGGYELVEEIARGGMGVVFRARQSALGRDVALKMVVGAELADPASRARLQREAQAAAALQHPHIVPVHEIGEVDLQPYFTMRLVPGGENIADWAARNRHDHRALAAAVVQVARAVAHAHERGVLHRDLKPSNVLWDPENGPQVTDFGLAKWLDDPRSSLSLSGSVLGSPSYMAPEQAAGRLDEITTATDVYGLGALLYELLTCDPPFQAASSLETLRRAQTEPPQPLSRAVPGIDRDLQTICLKCLEKDPAQRYATARELADELERWLRGEPIRARPVTWRGQLQRWMQRNPRLAASLAAAWFLLVAGMAGVTWQWRTAERARQGERHAREGTTVVVSDLLAKSGFAAAREGDPSRAALWFAHAAVATEEAARRSSNALRWRAWRDEAAVAVRAFAGGTRFRSELSWSADQRALIVQSRQPAEASVWDVAAETRWQPERPLARATWQRQSGRLITLEGRWLRILEFPAGREVARQEIEGEIEQVIVGPNDRWIGLGGREPQLWDAEQGRLVRLPSVPDREIAVTNYLAGVGSVWLEFSRDGQRVLLTGRGWRAVCTLDAPERFAVPPQDCTQASEFGFLGPGDRFLVHTREGRLKSLDSRTGQTMTDVPLAPPWDGGRSGAMELPSPDGRFLTRAAAPGVEIASGRVCDFPVHRNLALQHDYTPDGRRLVTGSADDTVRIWDLATGGAGQLIGWHQEGATSVAFSPDGRLLATGQGGGGLVRIWRLPTAPTRWELPESGPARAKLSADGASVLLGGWTAYGATGRSARVFRLTDGEPTGPELTPGGLVMDAVFGPEADAVTLAASDVRDRRPAILAGEPGRGRVSFWNHRTGVRREEIALPAEPRALAWHPGGRKLAVFGAGYSLYELEFPGGALRELRAPSRPEDGENEAELARCLYTPDGRLLLAWARFREPLVWEVETGRRVTSPELVGARVWDVQCHDPVLAFPTRQGRVLLLQGRELTPAAPSLTDSNWLFFARFDPRGETLFSGGRSRVARLWDWRAGRQLVPAMGHEDEVMDGVFVPGTPHLVTGGRDGRVHFWDARTGQSARSSVALGGIIAEVRVAAGGRLLVNRPRIDDAPGGAVILDLAALLAAPTLPPEEFVPLAELDASATIRNAELDPLSAAEWLTRWREFRARQPDWHPWGKEALR
ncbi:MAG: protein kinase [Verrucomicrobia bacterium]|nr:protein kinase [Verrucomicrobiota bacterium]